MWSTQGKTLGKTKSTSTKGKAGVQTHTHPKVVLSYFEEFQRSRLEFSQTIAEFAVREGNTQRILENNTLKQLYPMLFDKVPSIKYSAILALARICSHSVKMSREVVEQKEFFPVLDMLVDDLQNENVFLITTIYLRGT